MIVFKSHRERVEMHEVTPRASHVKRRNLRPARTVLVGEKHVREASDKT